MGIRQDLPRISFFSHIEAGQKYVYIILKTTGCLSSEAGDAKLTVVHQKKKKTWMQICATVTVDSGLPEVLTLTETSWPTSGPQQTLMAITFTLWQAVVLKKLLWAPCVRSGLVLDRSNTRHELLQEQDKVIDILWSSCIWVFVSFFCGFYHPSLVWMFFFSHVQQINW